MVIGTVFRKIHKGQVLECKVVAMDSIELDGYGALNWIQHRRENRKDTDRVGAMYCR